MTGGLATEKQPLTVIQKCMHFTTQGKLQYTDFKDLGMHNNTGSVYRIICNQGKHLTRLSCIYTMRGLLIY